MNVAAKAKKIQRRSNVDYVRRPPSARLGRLCVLGLLGLIFPCMAAAQPASELHGRVLDPDGAAVANASVRVYSRTSSVSVRAVSGPQGRYRIAGLPAGGYLLEAEDPTSALGLSRDVTLAAGASQELDIRLKIRSVRTEVLVLSSSTPLSLDEVAKAGDVVDGEQLERRAEFSLAEAVRNVPGVRVQQQRGPGGFTTIQSRGLRNEDTAVLIDGLRFRDAAGTQGDATAFLQDFQLVDASRVEFLRGSGSSLYGSHAIGGVLNMVTNQGGGDTHGEVSGQGGGLGLGRGAARIGGSLGASERLIYSGGLAHLNVTEGQDGFDPHRNSSGQGFARYNFTPSISLSGRVYAADSFIALNESPTFDPAVLANHPPQGPVEAVGLDDEQLRRFAQGLDFDPGRATFIPGFNDPDNQRAAEFFAGALIFRQELNPASSYRLSFHSVDTNRRFRDGPAGRSQFDPVFSNENGFDGRIDTFQARTDLRAGVHHLFTAGYEYEREEFFNFNTDENPDPALRPDSNSEIEQSSHAAFVQDQMRLIDGRVQLSLSGRWQSFVLDEPFFSGDQNPFRGRDFESPKDAFTGDAALAYFVRSSHTKFRAHAGNAYRAPSSFERFGGTSFLGSFSFWGDPRLSPERSIAFDAGVDQWFLDSKVRLSATYFYTDLQEVIEFVFGAFNPETDPFARGGGFRNTGGGLARGAEFSVSAAPVSSLNLNASYTYTNSDSAQPTIPGTDFIERLGISDHMFTLTATQRIGRRFDVTFDLFAASSFSQQFFGANRRLVFDGPVKADLVSSYTVPVGEGKRLRFFGRLENVFDNRFFEDGFATPGLWGAAGVKFEF